MKKIILISVISIISGISVISGQDIHFSQFYASPMLINPALTGYFKSDNRFVLHYKDQWQSFSKAYRTFAFSYDGKFFRKRSGFLGLGLKIYKDQAGDSKMDLLQGNISIAYHLFINKSHQLAAGLQGGFSQRSIDYSNVKWGSQYNGKVFDPSLSSNENYVAENFVNGDISAGILWSYTPTRYVKLHAGAGTYQINRPKQKYSIISDELGAYTRWTLHAGSEIFIKNTNYSFLPEGYYFMQGPFKEILVGSRVRYILREGSRYTGLVKETALSIGGYYRVGDAIIPVLQLDIERFSVGISYDLNLSGLTVASQSRGGVEITLQYITPFAASRIHVPKGTPMLD